MNQLSELSLQLLCKQYLQPDIMALECPRCHKKHESIDAFWDRVSFGVKEFRDYLERLDFLPNSPTLFNAGTGKKGTLSACFKFDVEDTMESIMNVAFKSAMVQKWGGGVGYCLSQLRKKDAPISSTHGRACGPVACLYLYQSVADLITQGGKRQGAQMAIVHCTHPDILEFVHCKDKGEALNTFNLSVAVTDAFMDIATRDPNSGEAILFQEIVKHAWECGDPGLFFIDEAERHNPTPHLGKLTGTNPCGEVPLLDNEPCNLASINLSNFVLPPSDGGVNDRFDFERLGVVAYMATKYLDYVLDHNTFPIPEITEAAAKTRKLGLGVMGWADALALLHIPYATQDAVDLGSSVMKKIQAVGHETSKLLAQEKGSYPGAAAGVNERNAAVTCIAPAGSISTIADCSSGIEPHYALEYTSVMGDGTPLKRKMRVLEECAPFVPMTAHEVGWQWHVAHQAAFQEHTDLAVSKTVNLVNTATLDDVYGVYTKAWTSKCKGVTVYRDGSKNRQALYKVGDVKQVSRRRLPVDRDGAAIHKFSIGEFEGYLIMGKFKDGSLGEVFIKGSKQGSTVNGLLDTIAILTSISLQYGVPLETLVDKFMGVRFEPAGITGNKEIETASSVIDYLFRFLGHKFLNGGSTKYVDSGLECPSCGSPVILQEGCLRCSNKLCSWSRC